MKRPIACLALGIAVGFSAAVWTLQSRAHWLMSLEFELHTPAVPTTILASVRQAEHRYYSNSSALRWAVEEAQDILAFASPELAYRANFSLGRYRIKAQTIEDLLPWAVEQEYVSLENTTLTSFAHALAYFAEQPVLSDWQAAIYLAWLKEEHPQMRDLAWAKVAADPFLIAKLYSGYMGAGGAWETWRESLTPGPVAKRRLGLQ